MIKFIFLACVTIIKSFSLWNNCHFGAEFSIDEFKALSNNELYNSVVKYQVINVKNLSISPIELEHLGYVFGQKGYKSKNFPIIENTSHVSDIIKPKGTKSTGSSWHVDLAYRNITTTMTLLYGINTPSDGTTSFVSTYNSYLSLTNLQKNLLNTFLVNHTSESKKFFSIKPIIIYHPDLLLPCLLLEGLQRMNNIVNKTIDESIFVLSALINQTITNVCTYNWKPNDLLIFDNRCLIHKADSSTNTEYRRILRIFMYNEY